MTYPELAHPAMSRYKSSLFKLKVTQHLSRRNLDNNSI
jgi:hypothetical protein